MPRKPVFPPRLVHHRPSGLARVRWQKVDYYLGPWDTAESRRRYAELLARIERTGSAAPPPADLTVLELAAWWADWAPRNYPARSNAPYRCGLALTPLVALCGDLPAAELSPRRLKDYLRHGVTPPPLGLGWCRNHANGQLGKIKTVVKAAVGEELIPGSVYEALRCVRALPPGAPGVRETAARLPARPGDLAAILPHCPPPVAGMLRLQEVTGMRSGEVRTLRPCDLDRSGPVWVYRPAGGGKTAHHGPAHRRAVALGPRAQAVLAPWLLRCPADDAFVFPPASGRTPGYSAAGYSLAVARACERAGVKMIPYALRHRHKLETIKRFGVAASMASMGQKSSRAFDQYGGGQDLQLAMEVAAKMG